MDNNITKDFGGWQSIMLFNFRKVGSVNASFFC